MMPVWVSMMGPCVLPAWTVNPGLGRVCVIALPLVLVLKARRPCVLLPIFILGRRQPGEFSCDPQGKETEVDVTTWDI